MKTLEQPKKSHRGTWLSAVIISTGLAGIAIGMNQINGHKIEQPGDIAVANRFSRVFREVSTKAMPSVVSIRTTGKTVSRSTGGSPFGKNSPFKDFFENDPQLKEFFKQQQQQQQPQRQQYTPHGQGSGFVIDSSGIIMTNAHVVKDASEVVVRLSDGREFTATDIKFDPQTDVAIVHINPPEDLQALPLGDSTKMQTGDWVIAVGTPFGLELSVTQGIISGKSRAPGINQREKYLQTDAAINPGNSGGPLLNLNGEVIGINTAISSRGGGSDGIGFAIPINMARWVSNQLVKNGKVSRSYLGVSIQSVTKDIASQMGLDEAKGALVNSIVKGSPAEAAKLEVGDIIYKLDNKQVNGPRELQLIVEQLEQNKSYKLDILRNGKAQTLNVILRAMPDSYGISSKNGLNQNPQSQSEMKFDDLGISVQEINKQLAEQLQLKTDHGVVITSVKEGSLAAESGLKAEMVIQKVQKTTIHSLEDYKKAMKSASLKKGVLLLVSNKGRSMFVVIKKK